MKTLFSWSVTVLLAMGSALLVSAQQPLTPDPFEQSCQQSVTVLDPQARGGRAAAATVVRVDHQSGLLSLETDSGRVLTFAAPEEIQDLREGDQIMVCMAEVDPPENPPRDVLLT